MHINPVSWSVVSRRCQRVLGLIMGTAVCDRHTIIFYMHDELDFLFRVSRFHSLSHSHSHSRFHFRFHFGNSRTRLLDNFPLNTLQFFFVSWREGKGYSQQGQRVAWRKGCSCSSSRQDLAVPTINEWKDFYRHTTSIHSSKRKRGRQQQECACRAGT